MAPSRVQAGIIYTDVPVFDTSTSLFGACRRKWSRRGATTLGIPYIPPSTQVPILGDLSILPPFSRVHALSCIPCAAQGVHLTLHLGGGKIQPCRRMSPRCAFSASHWSYRRGTRDQRCTTPKTDAAPWLMPLYPGTRDAALLFCSWLFGNRGCGVRPYFGPLPEEEYVEILETSLTRTWQRSRCVHAKHLAKTGKGLEAFFFLRSEFQSQDPNHQGTISSPGLHRDPHCMLATGQLEVSAEV
jgi:hypothetical protein